MRKQLHDKFRRHALRLAAALLAAGLVLPASAADLLASAKARGALRIAMEGTYPPFNFKDPKTGELTGYDVDVARLTRSCRSRPARGSATSSAWASRSRKNNSQFKAALNKALAEAGADGSLKKISVKWFGADVSRPAQ